MQPLAKEKTTVSLDVLYRLIQEDMKHVDATILSRIREKAPLIYEVAHHLIASGGKRIRPAVTLISALACEYKGGQHISLAAAVELLHTATLLHDDVVDESGLRRGLATANATFGNKASILVGDFLLSQAFQLMATSDTLDALKLLADASAVISQGEVLQLANQGNTAVSEADYLAVLAAKTAALFSCASELGAVIAGRPELRAPLAEYGTAIGMAFQLVDDALDYSADQKTLGKTVGDDFREGKITLPVLIAYEAANDEEKAFWRRTMEEGNQQPDDLAQATLYLHRHRALAKTIERAQEQAARAKEVLAPLAASPAKNAMFDLADFCIARAY
ncbi:MAG: polyprenyl synthetase family protein [Alphaproteobacteria bacterium]|nr:polyprenyl synthetase family protein [Alphaproteobacteria bacterium]